MNDPGLFSFICFKLLYFQEFLIRRSLPPFIRVPSSPAVVLPVSPLMPAVRGVLLDRPSGIPVTVSAVDGPNLNRFPLDLNNQLKQGAVV